MHAVAVVVVHAEEVVHVAGIPPGSPPEAHRAYRRMAAEPVGDVDVVDMLLDNVVARERQPVLPRGHQVIGGLRLDRLSRNMCPMQNDTRPP